MNLFFRIICTRLQFLILLYNVLLLRYLQYLFMTYTVLYQIVQFNNSFNVLITKSFKHIH